MSGTGMRVQLDDCWNRIGVRGDLSCPKLKLYTHCRNCPVHAAAAVALLDVPLPDDHLSRWTEHVARAQVQRESDSLSLVLFRIGAERLALPTVVFDEIADLRPIHSLPQRRNGVILGVCNVRGELRVCVSLQRMLGIEPMPPLKRSRLLEEARLLVLQHAGSRVVVPVDDVLGIHRFPQRALQPVPATVGRATATYSRALLQWEQQPVGVLDETLLFPSIDRSLQSSTGT
jgi:chemotaxis-related protein WspD